MITLTDMFCGCGGSTTGAARVDGVHVRLAMNHWRLAVESHNHNHPGTDHDCADISETHPGRYAPTTGLIASPECTNHSLAKGARRTRLEQGDFFQSSIDPAAVRSRATMWDVVRFAEQHRYEFVITENVVDVRRWSLFEPWLAAMHALGYRHRCVYLNAKFAHGEHIDGFVPQSRDRIYVVFWKKGNRAPDLDIRPKAPCARCGVVEAVQAWKPGRTCGKYGPQYVYRCSVCADVVEPFFYAALNALDLSLPAERIGDRKTPLRPKTLARIEYGLKKYGLRELVLSLGRVGTVRPGDAEALGTTTTADTTALALPYLVETAYSHSGDNRTTDSTEALPTASSRASLGVVLPWLQSNRNNSTPQGLDGHLHTLCGGNHEFVVSPAPFLAPLRSGRPRAAGVDDTLATLVGDGANHMLIAPSALLTMRGSRHMGGLDEGLPTQVAASIQNWILSTRPFLASYYGNDTTAPVEDAMGALTTRDRHALIHGSEGAPSPSIDDLYFRMLQPHEMLAGQGFPDGYVVLGKAKRDQVKQIGNANPPPTMQLLVKRCVDALAA